MAISVVRSIRASQATTLSVTATLGGTPTDGNYLIAAYRESDASSAVTMPSGWAWFPGSPHSVVGTRRSGIAYKKVAGDGTGVTFSSLVSDTKTLVVVEVAGLHQTSVEGPHGESANSTGVTSKNTGSTGVLPQADTYAFGLVQLAGSSGGTNAINSGFSLRETATGLSDTLLVAEKITAETTALDPSFSWLTARACDGQIATFKGAPSTVPGNSGDSLRTSLNRLAGTTGLDEEGAANIWAATTGLDLRGALNAKALTTGLDERGALNVLAGTTGLDEQDAARRIAA